MKGAELVSDLATRAKNTVVEAAETVGKHLDVGTRGHPTADELRDLEPGSKITVTGSGDVDGKVWRVVDAGGEFEIKKTVERQEDGTYKVTLEQGGKIGAQVGDDVSVGGRRGGKIVNEYIAKTPEEAAQLMQDVGQPTLSNPTPGRAREEMAEQAERMKRVNDARRSTEIVVEDSYQLSAELNPPGGIGVKNDNKVKPSGTMKVEYDESGRPTKLIVKVQTEIESTTMPRIGVNTKGGGANVSPEIGLKTKVTVSREMEIDLPPDFDVTRLASDPAGVVRELKDGARVKPNKVELEQTVGTTETKVTLVGKDGRDVDVPKLLTELGPSDPLVRRRDANDVLRDANVDALQVETYEKTGLDVKVDIDVGVGGVEVGYERTLRTKKPTVVVFTDGRPAEVKGNEPP